MAVFGIPRVHEDDALRACRAVAAIRERVEELGLQVRIGVNTGEVVAGTGETLVTGDAVNVAARLEQAARPGEILLGEGSQRLVREAVRSEAVEALELKGKVEPIPAYRLLELLPDVPAFTRPIYAPFVGREQELTAVGQVFATAVEKRLPQLATVVGPPGIGKSRLIRELIQRCDARVVVGRCLSYGEGITYWPLQEIVEQLAGVEFLDDELARLRIGAALGEGTASREEIAWGFRRLFETLAGERPLIVVLDDIHWAEPALLDLIEYVSTFAAAPLLLLCSARPDLFEERPAWSTPKPNAILVALEPLVGSEAEALVEGLRDVPAETRERIVAAAEGNPLFLEQLLAHQAESGNGVLDIPPTIHALLSARIDRLEEDERAVIERASIEGRLFHRGSVQELVPEPVRADVGGHLLTLVRKELVRPDRSQLPGDDGFRFGHILIRDAAYESVPKRLRAELHERFADFIAQRMGDEAPDEILGYHLEQSYRYGAELGVPELAVARRAAEKLGAAAYAAAARQDVAAAVKLFERSLALAPEEDEGRPILLVGYARALVHTAQPERAEATFQEAARMAKEAGDSHVEWLARIGYRDQRMLREPEGAVELALEEARAAIAERTPADDHEVLARAWFLIAEAHNIHARGAEQTTAIERGLEHARRVSEALELEILARALPPIAFGPISVDDGFSWAEDVLERLPGNPSVQNLALHILGHLRAKLGQFDAAREAMTPWREQFRELGQEKLYTTTAVCIWEICSLAEEWEEGERVLRESYEKLERIGEKGVRSTVAAHLAEAVYRQGRLDEAERYTEMSNELGSTDDAVTQAAWRAVRAKVLAARGQRGSAESLGREAVEIAAGTDFFELHGGVLLDLAEILRAAGRSEDAKAAAREALALFERKGNLVLAERARAQL